MAIVVVVAQAIAICNVTEICCYILYFGLYATRDQFEELKDHPTFWKIIIIESKFVWMFRCTYRFVHSFTNTRTYFGFLKCLNGSSLVSHALKTFTTDNNSNRLFPSFNIPFRMKWLMREYFNQAGIQELWLNNNKPFAQSWGTKQC